LPEITLISRTCCGICFFHGWTALVGPGLLIFEA